MIIKLRTDYHNMIDGDTAKLVNKTNTLIDAVNQLNQSLEFIEKLKKCATPDFLLSMTCEESEPSEGDFRVFLRRGGAWEQL